MEEKFSLIDDPWILVRRSSGEVDELSIRSVLMHASEYVSLAGETEAQNFAVLRILEAILLAVIYQSNPDFQDLDPDEIREIWSDCWEAGELDMEPINAYLDEHHDEFWLYGSDHRFMQSELAQGGTHNTSAKLLGNLQESNNKIRLFQLRNGEPKEFISPSEAVRWLINTNLYDDTAVKKSRTFKEKELRLKKAGIKPDSESPGAGWGGKIGPVYVQGKNLFETLMLNCILLKNGEDPWESAVPYWEKQEELEEKIGTDLERRKIPVPDDLAALLTLPSRRIWLDVEKDGRISGYSLISGDFFDRTNADTEQFTFWRLADPKKKDLEHFIPRRHTANREVWRDLDSVFGDLDQSSQAEKRLPVKTPGIVQWLKALEADSLLPEDLTIQIMTPFVRYGDKDFFVIDLSSSSMRIYASLASKAGELWVFTAQREVNKIDKLAMAVRNLARNISLASGSDGERADRQGDWAQQTFYKKINEPFLTWIAGLNPALSSDPEQVIEGWRKQARRIAMEMMDILTAEIQPASLLRKNPDDKNNSYYCSVPEAEDRFLAQLWTIYPKSSDGDSKQRTQAADQNEQEVN